MRLLLAGMTLACLGQVAQANPYADSPATPAAAPAADASSPAEPTTAAPEPAAAAPATETAATPDYASLFAQPNQAAPEAAGPAPAGTATPQPTAATTPATPPPAAAATQPFSPPAQPAGVSERSALISGPRPTKLMQELMKAPSGAPLAGAPITLGEAVRDSRSRQDQTQRAKAYWDLAAAVADYYLAIHEAQELETFRAGITSPSKQWDIRLADAKTRIDAARVAAQAAQLQLQTLLGGTASSALPVPADVPHCGRYNAEYDEIFASRPDLVAKKLADVLALRHGQLRSMTQAIDDAQAALQQEVSLRNPANDGTELLRAQQLLSLQRQQFVARAREYNQEIAAYTELAAPADVPADRLVAMMIRTSAPVDQLRWGQGGIEPASAEEPAEANALAGDAAKTGGGAKPTFQAERRQEVRRPLQRLLGRDRERSIVVSRLRNLMDRE
ncbi:MAG: hypothetical protein JNL18_13690 [Planctomycetaceae bacterium]|nr:hypothetical protein [Planctomycetaceae bacterium]